MRLGSVALIFVLLLSLWVAGSVRAQSNELSVRVDYRFGEHITFTGSVGVDVPVQDARLFFRTLGNSHTYSTEATLDENGGITYRQDVSTIPLRAFSRLEYWLEADLASGETISSPVQTFFYEDNRFDWRARENERFRVHWYEGDTAFAQNVLDVAELGLENAQSLLPLELEGLIDIYAYSNAQDMRATLQVAGKNWVGAHADPDLGVMVVSLPAGPEQRLEMERQVPHELTHILLYQHLGNGYENLPVWLNEGLASVAELYPNPDYLFLLEKARQKNTLLPFTSLCQAFPRDASSAFLAYAQATSFTRYLHQQYGSEQLETLVQYYAQGMDCESGVQATFNSTLTQLERRWRLGAFGENAFSAAVLKLLPWLVILAAVILIPLLLSLSAMKKRLA